MNKVQAMAHSKVSIVIGITKVCADENNSRFEGYIHSGIGSRSVPVGRQAGRLSDKNMISLEFFKIL